MWVKECVPRFGGLNLKTMSIPSPCSPSRLAIWMVKTTQRTRGPKDDRTSRVKELECLSDCMEQSHQSSSRTTWDVHFRLLFYTTVLLLGLFVTSTLLKLQLIQYIMDWAKLIATGYCLLIMTDRAEFILRLATRVTWQLWVNFGCNSMKSSPTSKF